MYIIVLLRDVFHISLVIGPRSDVLAWGAADLGPITRPIWKTRNNNYILLTNLLYYD